jgi:L-lactate utilization protein LutC
MSNTSRPREPPSLGSNPEPPPPGNGRAGPATTPSPGGATARPVPGSASPPTPGAPDPRYARLPTDAQVEATAKNLRARGFDVAVVTSSEDARREVLSRIPAGSAVFDGASRTLEETGILKALAERPDITLIKPRLAAMDRKTQADEIRRLSQAPGVAIGSVHAITEDGEVIVASATGVQIGPYAYGAGRVVWVVGTQKIVPNFTEGLNRVERYSLPLEDVRARKAYGVGSSINRILIF